MSMPPDDVTGSVPGEDEAVDALDLDLLERYGALLLRLQPAAEPDPRVLFAFELARFEGTLPEPPPGGAPVEELVVPDPVPAGAGTRGAGKRLVFEGERLSLMVTVTRSGDALRLDGWFTPGEALLVVLQVSRYGDADPSLRDVLADDGGRFVLEDVPPGLARLVLYRGGQRVFRSDAWTL